jgi:hypothetical protein
MRNLAAILRSELKSLEAELAADPRSLKAQKIRELLAMYGDSCHAPTGLPTTKILAHSVAVPTVRNRPSKAEQIRFAIQNFMRPKGSAIVARSRLVEMAEASHWSDAAPVAIQLQKDSTRNPLSREDDLPPSSDGPTTTPTPVPKPRSNWTPDPNGLS